MVHSRLYRHDGTIATLHELSGRVSASLFQTNLHYDLCARVAHAETEHPGTAKVLQNLLALKSRVLMGATALLDEVRRAPGSVREVALGPLLRRVLEDGLTAAGVAVEPLPVDEPLIPRSVAVAFALKALLHRCYRLASRRLVSGRPVVRAWVDITEVMFGELFATAQVRVYPFSYGLRRQFEFVRSLASRDLRWSLDGVPYRLRDIIPVLAADRRRHLILAQAEWVAYDRFGAELLRAGVRQLYSSDEYEVGALAAGDRLLAHGAHYENTAHGIGLYCPQVRYSRFNYVNDYQAEFYRRHGNPMELCKRVKKNSQLPFDRMQLFRGSSCALVYVHQNFEAYNLPSESQAQAWIMQSLESLGRDLGVAVFVKLHPNMPAARFRAELPPSVQVVGRWSDLGGLRPVFLTIYSTAYYELAEVAPVLVYAAPTYNPSVYLDGDFVTFTRETLAEQVRRHLEPNAWSSLVDRQVMSLRGHV